jgi:hypothetical protein
MKKRQKRKRKTRGPRGDSPYGLSVPEAGRLVGLGRNASYQAAKRRQIPTIKLGGVIIVPKQKWLRILGALTK